MHPVGCHTDWGRREPFGLPGLACLAASFNDLIGAGRWSTQPERNHQLTVACRGVLSAAVGVADAPGRRSTRGHRSVRSLPIGIMCNFGDGRRRNRCVSPPRSISELVDQRGRKYLTADERRRFLAAVRAHSKPCSPPAPRTVPPDRCPDSVPAPGSPTLQARRARSTTA